MGWDQLLEMKKAAEKAQPKEQTLCPLCAYPLKKHKTKGLYCSFCGWQERR